MQELAAFEIRLTTLFKITKHTRKLNYPCKQIYYHKIQSISKKMKTHS